MKKYITYAYDPDYMDDCDPIICFHQSEKEAKEYAKQTKEDCPEVCVIIYEAIEI